MEDIINEKLETTEKVLETETVKKVIEPKTIKKEKNIEIPKRVIVEYLQGSNNAGLTKELPYILAKKLEATGKVRIVK